MRQQNIGTYHSQKRTKTEKAYHSRDIEKAHACGLLLFPKKRSVTGANVCERLPRITATEHRNIIIRSVRFRVGFPHIFLRPIAYSILVRCGFSCEKHLNYVWCVALSVLYLGIYVKNIGI